MKKVYIILFVLIISFSACADLDIAPLGDASAGNWYKSEQEIELALNDGYRTNFWPKDSEFWTDNESRRLGSSNSILNGSITPNFKNAREEWLDSYKAIARANLVLANLEKSVEGISDKKQKEFKGESSYIRASRYSFLISHYGDVPLRLEPFEGDIDKLAENTIRESKDIVLESIYSDYDTAAKYLPVQSPSGRVSKGAAYGMKARIALYMGDYNTARDAAKACIDLDEYKLYPDYEELFLEKGDESDEIIFSLPRSFNLDVFSKAADVKWVMPRNAGGWAGYNPSWDLLASYTCTDGETIDKSPLFDPKEPFKNRDPRCAMTIAAFGEEFLGFVYQPHPDSVKVFSYEVDSNVVNNDTRAATRNASYNGLIRRKGIDQSWKNFEADNDKVILRYADVLLMYAEALIMLEEDFSTARSMINQVRSRAYGVSEADVDKYPAVTTETKSELILILRNERRVELAFEGLRYMDLIRWRLAEKALTRPACGLLVTNGVGVGELYTNLIDKGLWFWGETPVIDEDGLPDFSGLLANEYCLALIERTFDASKQYLWPIPFDERLLHPHWDQNPGYE